MLGEADDMKGSPSDIDQPATPPERPRCKNRLRPFPVFVLFRPRGNSRTSAFSAQSGRDVLAFPLLTQRGHA